MNIQANNIAILWDVENVTPHHDSLFINGLMDYATDRGKISVATAYGDWTRPNLKRSSEVLADNAFEMIHVPKSKKNSADITLITNAIEIIFQYPHVRTVILVTGDADFRPLLLSLRKHGIETIIICDSKSASEDLLLLADAYKDFRDLIPDTLEDSASDDGVPVKLSFAEAVDLLKEAVQIMEKHKKPAVLGPLKVRVKLLNPAFDEKQLGFKTWKSFLVKASSYDRDIRLESTAKDMSVKVVPSAEPEKSQRIRLPFIIYKLIEAIHQSSVKDATEWVYYSLPAQILKNNDIDIKQYQYSKMRKLVEAAEKRGLVETKSEGWIWSVKLTREGQKYVPDSAPRKSRDTRRR